MTKRKLRDIAVSPIGMDCMGFSHGYGEIPDRNYSIAAIPMTSAVHSLILPNPTGQTCCRKTRDTMSESSARRFMISARMWFLPQNCISMPAKLPKKGWNL